MTDVAHSTLTGTDLHEPKGVAAATAGQVYVADGSGSGAWALPTLIKEFIGTPITFAMASGYSFTHGLGAIPKLLYPYFVCTTADQGYAVGDELPFDSVFSFNTLAGAFACGPVAAVAADTSIVRVIFGAASNTFLSINKSTAAYNVTLTISSWKVNVRAWA